MENAPQMPKIECEFELIMSHPHVKNKKSINPLEWWKKNLKSSNCCLVLRRSGFTFQPAQQLLRECSQQEVILLPRKEQDFP